MATNQGKIIESLEEICKNINPSEFIYQFLSIYGVAKATISRLRNGSRNIASKTGDVGIKKQLYFRSVVEDSDVYTCAVALKSESVIALNNIRFIIVTDFNSLIAFDLKANESLDIDINQLATQYAFFLPLMAGYEKAVMHSEHPADIKATEKMGQLYDLIKERNDLSKKEDIHALNIFLTRLLFCFYAEDTGIFEQDQMTKAIQSTTANTGSDLSQFFSDLFTALNLPESSPDKLKLAAHFQSFPYVNGGLFKDDYPIPLFSSKGRRILLECGSLSWAEISPDIFGSMFQAVIDQEQRGNLGQHYTSVSNIMKVIKPLFLDKLWHELDQARSKHKKLKELLVRLQNIRVFDPACGSGNFLIIAYKELRKLEMAVIDTLNNASTQSEIYYSGISLSQFYGIEIDDFAREIATLSLWLAEHQMNLDFRDKFGYSDATLPLKDSGNIIAGNALRLSWIEACPPLKDHEIYICGNPPFQGAKRQSPAQKKDMQHVFSESKSYKNLDYVSCWFMLSVKSMRLNPKCEAALVSTSSIVQGDLVGLLWDHLNIKSEFITFGYTPFKWINNARQNAGVSCVILGLSCNKPKICKLYTSEVILDCESITPYLTKGTPLIIRKRNKPISKIPEMIYGNMPLEGGHLKLQPSEAKELVDTYPIAEKFIFPIIGGNEFLKNEQRFALWIDDNDLEDAIAIPEISRRINAVKNFRENGGDVARTLASRSHQFRYRHRAKSHYIFLPCTFSEGREYLQVGYVDSKYITLNSIQVLLDAPLFILALLSSKMHAIWTKATAGTLESRIRYSNLLCYNTFPVPSINIADQGSLELLAENLLLVREDYIGSTVGELYNPSKMPQKLKEAHEKIDKVVDKIYKLQSPTDDLRLNAMLEMYELLTQGNT